jgi:hypothetical protein
MQGKLDFLGYSNEMIPYGIEAKNIREWIYPNRPEVKDLLLKATSVNAVPVLIARRIHYVTFQLLNACGAIIHQTYNQVHADADRDLAAAARAKQYLGFHDIRTGNLLDDRLKKFLSVNLPKTLPRAQELFLRHRDLIHAFASNQLPYRDFASELSTDAKTSPLDIQPEDLY